MGCVLIYGTFDLFHLGHKNILDGAKKIAHERNLDLIVGVAPNDEVVKGFEFCLENDFVNGSLLEINGEYSYE